MKRPSCTRNLIGLTLALTACGQPRSSDKPIEVGSNDKASVEQDIARTEDSVRLSLAEKRIVELQRKMAEMEATPESVEIELVKGRLEAVEAKAYARQDDPAPPVDYVTTTPTPTRATNLPSRTEARPATAPKKREGARTALRLPELERSARPATDAEKAAFSTRPH